MKLYCLLLFLLFISACGGGRQSEISVPTEVLIPEENTIQIDEGIFQKKLKSISSHRESENNQNNNTNYFISDSQEFLLEEGVVSFILQLEANTDSFVGIHELISPSGKVYITNAFGSYESYKDINYFSNYSISSIQFPNNESQIVESGIWQYKIFSHSAFVQNEIQNFLIIRKNEISDIPKISIQPILNSAILISTDLESAMVKLENELKVLGFMAEIEKIKVANSNVSTELIFNSKGHSEEGDKLLDNSLSNINVLFVDNISLVDDIGTSSELKTLGVTGLQNKKNSQHFLKKYIAINIGAQNNESLAEMGGVVAHEIGHCYGLRHTSERNGVRHDELSDTDECDLTNDVDGDGIVDGFECANFGGDNFMFWLTEVNVIRISPQQFFILQHSPFVK